MNNLKKIFKSKYERKVEKEKNAKINEKKKEDESKAQVILMIHKKHINKLLLSIYKLQTYFFLIFFLKLFVFLLIKMKKY